MEKKLRVIPRFILTIAVYLLLTAALYIGTVYQGQHVEVAFNGSLICYSCIGVN